MLGAFVCAQLTDDLLSPEEQTVLKNAVDLTAGFFNGFGKSKVANDILEVYQIADGTFTVPPPKQPCGTDDIEDIFSGLINLF